MDERTGQLGQESQLFRLAEFGGFHGSRSLLPWRLSMTGDTVNQSRAKVVPILFTFPWPLGREESSLAGRSYDWPVRQESVQSLRHDRFDQVVIETSFSGQPAILFLAPTRDGDEDDIAAP